MIESALILIHAVGDRSGFVGCGVLIEGGFIATCRHVWEDATSDGAAAEVEFPRSWDGEETVRLPLTLADPCLSRQGPHLDLVLLRAAPWPTGVVSLQLAMTEGLETGLAKALTRVARPCSSNDWKFEEVSADGVIQPYVRSDGRRQLTGTTSTGYWFTRGSSGGPLFKEGGQQLAAMLSLSELGKNEQRSSLQEAFVVPGTAIRAHVARLVSQPVAREEKLDPLQLAEVLSEIGAADAPISEIPTRLRDFVAAARMRAVEPRALSIDGADINAAIAAARDRLARLDTQGALDGLRAKLAEEEEARRQRMVPLLAEQAAIEMLTYDYPAAKATLERLLALAPDEGARWIDLGDLHVTTGNLAPALAAFSGALVAAERVEPGGRNVAISHDRIGGVLMAQGEVSAALAEFRKSMDIAAGLAATDPANSEWQRDLSISHDRIGDVLRVQGKPDSALAEFRKSQMIRARMVDGDPSNTQWQRDLSVSHVCIGDVLQDQRDHTAALAEFRKDMDIAVRLVADDPANTEWQRDLSVSHDRIGDALVAQGKRAAALEEFRKSQSIRARLVAADPANATWQRDLSISHNRIGDVLRAQGKRPAALAEFRTEMAIASRLAAVDPTNAEWQRDLAVSHQQIGDVLRAQGERVAALAEFRKGIAIAARLADADPSNAEWQRDLAMNHNKIGDVLMAQKKRAAALAEFRKGMDIAARLTAEEPANAKWQRDLSVSHIKIGNVLRSQGKNSCALAEFSTAMEIRSRRATAEPANGEWQRELAASREKIGEVQRALGEGAAALAEFHAALAIYDRLLARNPEDAPARLASVLPLWRIGAMRGVEGRAELEAALAILRELNAAKRLDLRRRRWIPKIKAALAALDP